MRLLLSFLADRLVQVSQTRIEEIPSFFVCVTDDVEGGLARKSGRQNITYEWWNNLCRAMPLTALEHVKHAKRMYDGTRQ